MRAAFTALGRLVEARRRGVLLGWAAIALGAVALLPRFRIDPDLTTLLPSDDSGALALAGHDGLDPGARDLLVVVRDRALVAERARFDALVDELRRLPEVARVAATREAFQSTAGPAPAPLWSLPDAQLDALEARLLGDGRRAAIAESLELLVGDPILGRSVVEADPLGLRWAFDASDMGPLGGRLDADDDRLVLAGGSAAIVRVTAQAPPMDQAATARLMEGLDDVLGGVDHDRIGGHAIGWEHARRIRGDMVRSSVTSAPLVLLFLVLSLGSLALAHVVLLPVAVAVVGALGFGGALLGPLPVLAVASAAILVGLGVDFALHVVTRLEAEHDRDPVDHVARAIGGAGPAVLAGGGTSIAAFLSFAATSIEGLARFGALLAIGLGLALTASLTLVPALGLRLAAPRPSASPVVRMCELVAARPRWRRRASAAVAVVALAAALITVARGVRFDAGPSFMQPAHSEARAATERFTRELGFAPTALVVLSPANAAPTELHAAGSELLARPDVGLIRGGAGAAPVPGRAERIAAFRASTRGWLDGALVDLTEAGLRAERLRPVLLEQASELARDPAVARDDRIEHAGGSWVRTIVHPSRPPLERADRDALRAAVRSAFPPDSQVVDPYGLGDALAPALASAFERAVLIAAAIVAALVLVATRGLRRAAVALAPCLVALAVTLAVLSLAGWPVHPGNLVALPLVLGLGVDDGLHLVLRLEERGAAGTALGTTGRAIWRTTATTVLGFGSLAFATTPALVSLGVIVAIGTLTAFLATVTLVPAWIGRPSGAEVRSLDA